MLLRRQVLTLLVCGVAGQAMAQTDGLGLLDQFLQTTRSGRAQFTQVVTSVSKVGQRPRQKTSAGTLEFLRPGRFRFTYKRPFTQTLVADGQTLWLHDPDLQQVTARAQSQVLSGTPLALIISANDLGGLQKDFALEAEPARDGLQWVKATPKRSDGQLQQALAGLRTTERGPELAVLEVLDALGQRSVLNFSAFEINPVLSADAFVFRPPAGTDAIRP